MCVSVLGRLLSAIDPTVLLHQFHNELLAGLNHPQVQVRVLALNQVVLTSCLLMQEPESMGTYFYDSFFPTLALFLSNLVLVITTQMNK